MPLEVSWIVTTIVSPLDMNSRGPAGLPFVVIRAAVVGSLQLFICVEFLSCSVLMWRSALHCVFDPLIPGGKNCSSRKAAPAVDGSFASLFATQGPYGFEFGSQRARPIQNAMYSSKLATLLPSCMGAGSVAGSWNFHRMLLPESPAVEKNRTVGSACPM